MVVSLSALRTGHFYPSVNIPGIHFCWRLSRPQDYWGSEPAPLGLVAQCLNQLCHRVPPPFYLVRAKFGLHAGNMKFSTWNAEWLCVCVIFRRLCGFYISSLPMPRQPPCEPGPSHCRGSMIAPRHATLGRIPLDEWLFRSRYLYLTIHNTLKRQTSIPMAGFEPLIPSS